MLTIHHRYNNTSSTKAIISVPTDDICTFENMQQEDFNWLDLSASAPMELDLGDTTTTQPTAAISSSNRFIGVAITTNKRVQCHIRQTSNGEHTIGINSTHKVNVTEHGDFPGTSIPYHRHGQQSTHLVSRINTLKDLVEDLETSATNREIIITRILNAEKRHQFDENLHWAEEAKVLKAKTRTLASEIYGQGEFADLAKVKEWECRADELAAQTKNESEIVDDTEGGWATWATREADTEDFEGWKMDRAWRRREGSVEVSPRTSLMTDEKEIDEIEGGMGEMKVETENEVRVEKMEKVRTELERAFGRELDLSGLV
ncbi:hypothetical protein GQ43DRAFT_54619 [Delitschia confertaspora ATCC 74209]|uniref:Uncharacterized protein n=1 Tax=Delitschia confertaspora ATCC 74209 TaxID=1513339 RepID=A0A9P4JPW1_9PLEO|nr:hypothetical protein GQ43DRAFT_54619 [Delitschia confertaspora ATCC 74209]